ncbi:hypothetical protein ASZ78_002863 [Callipepla squamata]|uniref:Prefoldin subunit 5 n=1 Tax=Callipepla squamata TaxID=9009 RepID=A0A226MK35_CALSU|nr:hypothetical protein ASZ78_002863 [Callipepla squamata]
MAQAVNVAELPLPQLEVLKSQLEQEVEFLSSSIAQLKVVQTKYVEAKDCLSVLNKSNEGKWDPREAAGHCSPPSWLYCPKLPVAWETDGRTCWYRSPALYPLWSP